MSASVASRASAQGRLTLLDGWGRLTPSAAFVARPHRPGEVDALLANPPRGGLIVRGLGRSYGDAAQNTGGLVVDARSLDRILDLDLGAGTVTAEGGVSLDRLMRVLLPLGRFVPVTPGTRFVTLGGAIAADIHGKNHHRDGAFCEHVTEIVLRTPRGRIVVAPDRDPDVFWATAGGMGLTGLIESATIAIPPVETAWIRADHERARDLDDCLGRLDSGDRRYQYSVAWIDCRARGRRLGRSVLERGDHAAVADLDGPAAADPLRFEPATQLAAPPWPPGGVLRPLTIPALNEAYFRRVPREERDRLVPLASFFHPLDGVAAWNRLYGSRGFAQLQALFPFGAEAELRETLERLAGARAASSLALLKRFGAAGAGPLSFPGPGWSLATDVFAHAADGGLLDRLHEVVAGCGGRVYLAKDSRLRPAAAAAMYPRLGELNAVRTRLDPDGVLRSDLSRRLALGGGVPA
ncbi:MAG TPA: FAD-binding oxidoreductase [Thermoleophilaceae bacterium]|jgi:decaprenylphospho-beta-D-ribofuranose 2-oxidase